MTSALSRDMYEYLETLGFDPEVGLVFPPLASRPATVPFQDSNLSWESLEAQAMVCVNCKLCRSRTKVVFGAGHRQARLMFVGEGPGYDEDLQGEPFVGRAGQLLTKMIQAMSLGRDQVYIANVVKCRPPENRNPEPDEIAACASYLDRQIELVNPEIIVALGTFAGQTLLRSEESIGKLRGNFHPSPLRKRADGSDLWVLPTYHPAFLLRNPNMKKPVWEDLQKVMQRLGLKA